MSKWIWGIGGIAVISATVVGGNLYADKSLAAFYENNKWSISKDQVTVKYTNYKMGLMRGNVDWELTMKTDPCIPTEVVVLRGHDAIRRGFKGYTIDSTFNVIQDQSTAKFANVIKTDLNAETTVNWIGQSKTNIQIPAFKTIVDGKNIQADASQMAIHTFSRPGELTKLTEFSMQLPVLRVSEGKIQTMIQNFAIRTDQGLNQQNLESGFFEMQAGTIQRLDSNFNGGMRGMDLRWETKINQNDVDFIGHLKASEMDFPGTPISKDLTLNIALNNVSLDKVRAFSELWHQVENSCDTVHDSTDEMLQAFLAIVNQGFDFESKDNSISVGGGKATANLSGKMMPGHHASLESFVKMVPSLLDFHADLSFDKNMMTAVMNNYLQLQDKTVSEQEIEAMFAGLESSGQGKREGNNMLLSMQYKFGQKSFGQAANTP